MSTVPTTAASVNPPSTCVASLEWDQVLSPDPLPPHDGTDRWHEAVTKAAHIIANHPDFIPESKRLAAAIALARARAVRLLDNDKAQVRSGTVTYELGPACPCQDALRVSKYCKHLLATLITKEAYAQLRPAPSRSTAPPPAVFPVTTKENAMGIAVARPPCPWRRPRGMSTWRRFCIRWSGMIRSCKSPM